jgi:hypothetical protein
MKKVDFKKVIMALSVALAFLFLGVERADAQSIAGPTSGLSSIPAGVFVGVDQALVLLHNKMQEIKTDLSVPGLPVSVSTALEKKLAFYGLIHLKVEGGETIPKSITHASVNMVTDAYGVAQNAALAMKQEAITLLSN